MVLCSDFQRTFVMYYHDKMLGGSQVGRNMMSPNLVCGNGL